MPRKQVITRKRTPPLLVRGDTRVLERFKKFSDEERLTYADAMDVLIRGWDRLGLAARVEARTKGSRHVNA